MYIGEYPLDLQNHLWLWKGGAKIRSHAVTNHETIHFIEQIKEAEALVIGKVLNMVAWRSNYHVIDNFLAVSLCASSSTVTSNANQLFQSLQKTKSTSVYCILNSLNSHFAHCVQDIFNEKCDMKTADLNISVLPFLKYWKTSNIPKIKLSELLADNNDEVVFDRNAIISVQPFSGNELRSPLPISTISGPDSRHSHILPISGLAHLFDVQEITIEQTIELDDLASVIESENRFLIKTDGQTIYGAHENSSAIQRLFCGTGRRFILRLFDRSKQEALYMTRRLACSFPLIGCYLQRMDVFEPPCTYLGCIQQKWTISGTIFSIRDMNDYEIFTIIGPSTGPCCCHYNDTTFTVFDVASTPVTSIEHQWDQKIMNYKLSVKYPNGAGLREKALLLSGGMLLEYVFFSSSKSNSLCCFNCHK